MKKIFPISLLFLIFALALFFRFYFIYDRVFSEPIKYAADDGVYHMRLVENELLGNHFPRRIYFDPYTYFPYGTYVSVAPLFSKLLSLIIWVISLGKPTLEIINKIAPFYPAVLGSLMVFLVYFIAKAIWGRKVGLFSSFLMAISPPYLSRSLLGATDQHVAEVLFSTLAMLFLILAIKARATKTPKNKKLWLFTLLTGFSLGLYFLTWSGALLFLFIIFVSINLYYLIEYFSKRNHSWILFMGIIIFLMVLVMIFLMFGQLFFIHPDFFQTKANPFISFHLKAIILGIFGFISMGIIGGLVKKKKMNPWFLPIFLVLGGIIGLGILKFIFPFLFDELIKIFQAVKTGMVHYKFARELVSEMVPLGFQGAINTFSSLFYLSLIALVIIFYKFIKKKKPEHFLIIVWTIVITLMTGIIPFFGLNRFIYYLACNISLLSGFLIVKGFGFGWRGLKIAQKIPRKSSLQPYFLVGSLLIIFNVIFFLLFPYPFNIGNPFPNNLPAIFQSALAVAKGGLPIREDDWYETFKWLRENTPEPGVDYYAFYQGPGVNKETGEINPYPYPEDAYGVLARWDVGSMMVYYSHRMPNANNFQQGIGVIEGGEIKELGEAIFFLENEEEKAIKYLDELKTRYVISDYLSAHPKGTFASSVKWVQGNFEGYYLEGQKPDTTPNKFDNSMIARLHLLDGKSETTEREVKGEKIKFYIKPLDHFRLVYESKQTVISLSKDPGEDIKAVKVFEYVKGVKIVGQAKTGTEVTISTEIETNQERKFVYQKSVKAENGNFEFVVPYSTFSKEGRLPGQTQFEVFAKSYKLKIGNKEIEINVSEKDILEGEIINVSDF